MEPLSAGKEGGGGKPPSNSLLVIKMDAIYFFWHSNYIDVCRQLFVPNVEHSLSCCFPLTFDTVSPQGWQALGWRARLAKEPPRLGWSWLPWSGAWPSDVPRVVPRWGEAGGRCFPLSFHTPFTSSPSPPSLTDPTLLPSILCVNENSGSLTVKEAKSHSENHRDRGKSPLMLKPLPLRRSPWSTALIQGTP